MFLVIVFGRVATGKTELVDYLVGELHAVSYQKDSIKETAYDVLGDEAKHLSSALGALSIELVLQLTAGAVTRGVPVIAEGNFNAATLERFLSRQASQLETLPVVLIRCEAADDVVLERFEARAVSGQRHPGHNDVERTVTYRAEIPTSPDWPGGSYMALEYEAGVTPRSNVLTAIRDISVE